MNDKEREALARELKKLTGDVTPSGSLHVDPEVESDAERLHPPRPWPLVKSANAPIRKHSSIQPA